MVRGQFIVTASALYVRIKGFNFSTQDGWGSVEYLKYFISSQVQLSI
jgi:hypothetical protein